MKGPAIMMSPLGNLKVLLTAAALLAANDTCFSAITPIGPTAYLSTANSPFLTDSSLDVVLEDFEDGQLNAPGIETASISDLGFSFGPFANDGRGIVVPPSVGTDSVDADDGEIDGLGNQGYALRSTATLDFATGPPTFDNVVDFRFTPNSHGHYPIAFGFVWTDGEPGLRPDLFTKVSLGVTEIDGDGQTSVSNLTFDSIVGDSEFDGGTSEDRFVGVLSDTGIEAVRVISSFRDPDEFDDNSQLQLFFEMDHIQIGYAIVPEPGTAALLSALCMAAGAIRTNTAQGFAVRQFNG